MFFVSTLVMVYPDSSVHGGDAYGLRCCFPWGRFKPETLLRMA